MSAATLPSQARDRPDSGGGAALSVTALGLFFGIAALLNLPDPVAFCVLGGLSLLCDLVDGAVARMTSVTRLGAETDWHTDVALAHACAWVSGLAWLSLPLVLLQAYNKSHGRRVSGRAAAFVAAGLWAVWGALR